MSVSTALKNIALEHATVSLLDATNTTVLGPPAQPNTGSLNVVDATQLTADAITAGTVPTKFIWYNTGVSGSGLVANNLQCYGYFDGAVTVNTVQQYLRAYPAPVTGTAPPLTTTPVVRIPMSKPIGWDSVLKGTTIGNGATPVVVPIAGIADSAGIRFYLLGTNAVGYAPIVPPSNVSVQPNVSFTWTGTQGAIYGYEVLQE